MITQYHVSVTVANYGAPTTCIMALAVFFITVYSIYFSVLIATRRVGIKKLCRIVFILCK